jgi:hypothetical protein
VQRVNSHQFIGQSPCNARPCSLPRRIEFYNRANVNKSIFCASRPIQQTRTRKLVLHLRTITILENKHHHSDRAHHARSSSLPNRDHVLPNRECFVIENVFYGCIRHNACYPTTSTQLHLPNSSLHNIPHDKNMHH